MPKPYNKQFSLRNKKRHARTSLGGPDFAFPTFFGEFVSSDFETDFQWDQRGSFEWEYKIFVIFLLNCPKLPSLTIFPSVYACALFKRASYRIIHFCRVSIRNRRKRSVEPRFLLKVVMMTIASPCASGIRLRFVRAHKN